MRTKIQRMIIMQGEMNSIVNPNWTNMNWAWWRAVHMECSELIDHVGWKWWKKQEPNVPQIHLELVDIFHFIMSELIIRTKRGTGGIIYRAFSNPLAKTGFGIESVEKQINFCTKYHATSIGLFVNMCSEFDLSFDRLYQLYIMKNVLNRFRQANGYKEGTYIKNWALEKDKCIIEDNEYLMSLNLDWDNEYILDIIIQDLTVRYVEVVSINS